MLHGVCVRHNAVVQWVSLAGGAGGYYEVALAWLAGWLTDVIWVKLAISTPSFAAFPSWLVLFTARIDCRLRFK